MNHRSGDPQRDRRSSSAEEFSNLCSRLRKTTTAVLIGYARCSTDRQDLEANRQILLDLGVSAERIYLDQAYSGTSRARPGPGPRRRAAQ